MVDLSQLVRDGRYLEVLTHEAAQPFISKFVNNALELPKDADPSVNSTEQPPSIPSEATGSDQHAVVVGLAAFNAFLQSNVTGPVLEEIQVRQVYKSFENAYSDALKNRRVEGGQPPLSLAKACLQSLDVDGVSVYPYIPHIELFCLARWLFVSSSGQVEIPESLDADPATKSLPWLRLRIHVWHYKLLSQPTLGPGSIFNKSLQWTDIPSLQGLIQRQLSELERSIDGALPSPATGPQQLERQQFQLEKTGVYIMLGLDAKAKEAVSEAARVSRLSYVLSGALGKRTRYQEKSTSQLVVLAKSATGEEAMEPSDPQVVPGALPLNDDTLLEKLDFSEANTATKSDHSDSIPDALKDLAPDDQPQLNPLDQIVLLAEATIKDAFSPADSLTSEEILPYAVRVISDKPTNWQIFTHALLIRSRIEVHRSRTMERGILQMQALVDQVVVDISTTSESKDTTEDQPGDVAKTDVPAIRIDNPQEDTVSAPDKNKPTSFFPAPKPTESAPAHVRLRYIHVLSSPPRWHLESEMGYAWAGAGSLVSALEIFKRLRLWAEVALCYASSASTDDPDGRGSGGEEKARAILRWRLFQRSSLSEGADAVDGGESSITSQGPESARAELEEDVDISELKAADFMGPERNPPPSDAPRLFCLLGDTENEVKHYERAWELSNHRFARAQKLIGEYHLRRQEWESARDAYKKAVTVNRLSPETWSRLGDISLRLGAFEDAAEAFSRAIGAANDVVGGEDARTWSNLGSAFYSLYLEALDEQKEGKREAESREEEESKPSDEADVGTNEGLPSAGKGQIGRDPAALLTQSLVAYKRGASVARDNWRIWDNVITLAARVRPPAILDILQALRQVISIRNTEDAIDDTVLRLVITEGLLGKSSPLDGIPARGTQEKAICDVVENDIVPLITQRSELWELVSRERLWRGDLEGAIEAAEKGWRAAMGGVGGATLGATAAAGERRDWLTDREAWSTVVTRTDELVSMLENYGPRVDAIGTKWKGKARSALRSVMGKAKAAREGDEGWQTLESLLDGLKASG